MILNFNKILPANLLATKNINIQSIILDFYQAKTYETY